jgi:hypothetical protein
MHRRLTSCPFWTGANTSSMFESNRHTAFPERFRDSWSPRRSAGNPNHDPGVGTGMSGAYRDEKQGLRDRVGELEQLLAKQKEGLDQRDAELEELRRRLANQEALFSALKQVVDRATTRKPRRWLFPAIVAAMVTAVGTAWLGLGSARLPRGARAAPLPAKTVEPIPLGEPCARLGVRLTVDGDDAHAPLQGDQDLAGHKYHRDGSRSPWFTIRGPPLYVHGVGDSLRADVGTTSLSLLTIMTQGETDGHRLARGGKSLLEVLGSDGQRIFGRFEADMSKVADTTLEPPFGTPVVRVRGTFCLPAHPADPTDVGP